MRRRVTTLCALLLLAATALAEEPAPAPSAARAMLDKGDVAFRSRDYAGATDLYKEAIALAEKHEESETLVEAPAMAARGHLTRGDAKSGRPFIERAGKLATDKQPRGWSRYLGVLGRFEWKDGDKPKATKTFERMYDYCVKHELHSRAVDAAHMVAITGTKEQQLAWAMKGIAAAEAGKLDGWLGPLWNNLGITYGEMGNQEKALDAYKKARVYHWKGTSEVPKLAADWAIGMTLRRLKRAKEAKAWLRPVLAWSERRLAEKPGKERGEWVGLALLELGLVAQQEGRTKDAQRDLERAKPLLEVVNLASWHPALWKELTGALSELAASSQARPPR